MSDTIIRCRWTPLADRMPHDAQWVLLAWDGTVPNGLHAHCNIDTHFEVCYRERGHWLIAANTLAQCVNRYPPTHWMSLPVPPIGTTPDIICRRS